MSDRLEWHGEQAKDYVQGRVFRALANAARIVERHAKILLSVSGTIRKTATGEIIRDSRGRMKRVYGSNPSAPGEPPHKQTGRLRASVTYEVDERLQTARVGTNVKYGKYLELGTKRGLAPRPWLRRALAECRGRVEEILSGLGS